jgi:hypothetical protein
MNNFAQTINYMESTIDMITKNTLSNPRQISELNRNDSGCGNGGGLSKSRQANKEGRSSQSRN